jgi:hypothetical protein
VYDTEAFSALLAELEEMQLAYYEDFFELSGTWPEWLRVLVGSSGASPRSSPSQPHS